MRTATVTPSRARPALYAFTLVELLVVIGIIALLISILLPSLNRAREAAKSVKCSANLHSLGQALQIYLQDNKGMCPIGYWDGTLDPKTGATISNPNQTAAQRKTNWCMLLLNATNNKFPTTVYEVIALGQKGPISSTLQMLQCPTVPSDGVTRNNQLSYHYTAHPRIFASVGQNGVPKDPKTGQYWSTMKASRVKRSSEIATIFDGALSYDNASQTWTAINDVPIAQGIDNGKLLYGDGQASSTSLTDDYSNNYGDQNGNAPVNMRPFYGLNIADANKDDATLNPYNIRFRHNSNNKMNTLMFDGHVESFNFFKGSNTTDLLRKNINTSF